VSRRRDTSPGGPVTKPELMKVLETAVDDAMQTRMFGSLEICFQNGVAYSLKKASSQKLCSEAEKNSRHACKPQS
jgi:hypothetical protein